METDTDANVFVAYLFEKSTDDFRTTGWCQADWRSRWCNDHLYFEVSPHFIKRQSLIDDFYNTLFVSSPMNIGRFVNGTLCDSPFPRAIEGLSLDSLHYPVLQLLLWEFHLPTYGNLCHLFPTISVPTERLPNVATSHNTGCRINFHGSFKRL
jgi:hypothetical protein